MRISVWEPDFHGHRLQYVRTLALALRQFVSEVIVVTRAETIESQEFAVHLANVENQLTWDTSISYLAGTPHQKARRAAAALQRYLADTRPDHVYIPYGDGLTQIVGLWNLCGRRVVPVETEVEALLMRGRFAYPMQNWRDRIFNWTWLTTTRAAPFSHFHHLDPIPFEMIQRRGGSLAQRSRIIPEAIEPITAATHLEARKRICIPVDGRYIGCIGGLDQRKGIHLLLRAFASAKLMPTDRLLLIGRAAAPIRQLLDSVMKPLVNSGRIIIMDRYVSQEELHWGLSAMDVVCAPYPRHIGSSGVVARAAAASRPVLGSDFGWVGMVIRRFALGQVCMVSDIPAFAVAIRKSLDLAPDYNRSQAGNRFVEFHTVENQIAHWTKRLRERLKLSEMRGYQCWEDVTQPD